MSDPIETVADLQRWHRVDNVLEGDYLERFDEEVLEGVASLPFRFQVIRETWDETTIPRTRVIHEVKVYG